MFVPPRFAIPAVTGDHCNTHLPPDFRMVNATSSALLSDLRFTCWCIIFCINGKRIIDEIEVTYAREIQRFNKDCWLEPSATQFEVYFQLNAAAGLTASCAEALFRTSVPGHQVFDEWIVYNGPTHQDYADIKIGFMEHLLMLLRFKDFLRFYIESDVICVQGCYETLEIN